MFSLPLRIFFFFFNDTATTEIYTLSLHDALPILIALPTPRRPLRAVVRDARGRPVQHVRQPLLPPGVPLRRNPVFALLRLGDEPRRVAAVPGPAQVPPVQRSRERAGGRR